MKKLILVVLCLVVCGCAPGWDAARPTVPPKELTEYLMPVPDDMIRTYGNSERTQVILNVATLQSALMEQSKVIEALRAKVAKLERETVKFPED